MRLCLLLIWWDECTASVQTGHEVCCIYVTFQTIFATDIVAVFWYIANLTLNVWIETLAKADQLMHDTSSLWLAS